MSRHSPVPRLVAVSIALAALGAAVSPSRAPGQLPSKPGHLTVEPFRGFTFIHDAAQRRAQETLARRLLAVLERDPAIAHPTGYDVVLRIVAGDMPEGFNAGMTYFTGVAGEVHILGPGEDEQGRHGIVQVDAVKFGVFVNDRWCAVADYTESKDLPDHGPPIVEGLQRTAAVHGHPSFEGQCILVTDRTPPPFLPVTRDRYRRVQLLQMRAMLKKNRAELAQALADPNYRDGAKQVLDQEQHLVDSLQGDADAASPADRARPAAVQTNDVNDSSLVAVGTDDSYALERPNPAFFDPSLPRTQAQSIVLRLPYGVPDVTPATFDEDAGRRAVFTAIVRGLPWAALEAMVKH